MATHLWTYLQLGHLPSDVDHTSRAQDVERDAEPEWLVEAHRGRAVEHHGHASLYGAQVLRADTEVRVQHIAVDDDDLVEALRPLSSEDIEYLNSVNK